MKYRFRRETLATALVLFGLATPASSARGLQGGKGLTLTMSTSSTSPAEATPTVMMVVKLQMNSSGLVRGDVLPSGSPTPSAAPAGDKPPILVPGTYSLSKKGSDTTFVLDPSQKKYWIVVPPASQQTVGRVQYTNVEVSAQRVQPDSTVEGFPVQHWRVIDNVVIGGTTSSKSTYDIYSAPEFGTALAAGYFSPTAFAQATGDAAYGAKRSAAFTQAMPGVSLLMRTQTQIQVKQGKPMSMGMIMRATNISRGDPPGSVFAMPAGYTLVHPAQ
jgi:hypothetical protein